MKQSLENKTLVNTGNVICLNVVMTISLLRPQWFILISGFVVITEVLILNFFWKELKQAFTVAVITNLGSALVAIPLLLTCLGEGSLWFYLIVVGENTVTEGFSLINDLFVILLMASFFAVALLSSIVIETIIGRALKVPERKLIVPITVANFVTYSIIMTSLLGLGIWYGMNKRDPTIEAWHFFEGNLVHFLPIHPLLATFQLFIFFFSGALAILLSLRLLDAYRLQQSSQ